MILFEKCDIVYAEVFDMELLKRKIDEFLSEWKQNPDRLPLIVKGARQVGKTASIRQFGESNYTNVVEINFLL